MANPAALILPVSGPYTSTYAFQAGSPQPIGICSDDGYQLSCTFTGQEINATDAYGQTLIEGIQRGQNWRNIFRGLEWNRAGLLNGLQVFGYNGFFPANNILPILQNIGDRWSKYMGTMVLTAILGNPPSVPQTLTALLAGVGPNSQTNFNLTSKMREMPFDFVYLPYSQTVSTVTTVVPFTCT